MNKQTMANDIVTATKTKKKKKKNTNDKRSHTNKQTER